MDASPSPSHLEPDDSPPGTRTYITDALISDPETVIARFQCESPDGWTASGTIGYSTRHGLHITRMDIEPGPDNALTSALLRQIPTGGILAAAHASTPVALDANALVVEPAEGSRPGRAPLSDDLLATVAITYLGETAPGLPRGAVGRLADRFEKPKPTISRWIMRAREAGWLTPTAPGREGGTEGPRLAIVGTGAVGAMIVNAAQQYDLGEITLFDAEHLAQDVRERLAAQPKFTERSHTLRGVGGHPRRHEVKADQPEE